MTDRHPALAVLHADPPRVMHTCVYSCMCGICSFKFLEFPYRITRCISDSLGSRNGGSAKYTGGGLSRGQDQESMLTNSRYLQPPEIFLSTGALAHSHPGWASYGVGRRVLRPVLRTCGKGSLLRGPRELS